MNHPYSYIGCFVSPQELSACMDNLNEVRLANVIENPHVTFAYRPYSVDESIFGELVHIRIVAYGNDGTNEGVKVELFSDNAKINALSRQIEVPHITLSVSDTGEAVNTRYLKFTAIPPMELIGRFGGFVDAENRVSYVPLIWL